MERGLKWLRDPYQIDQDAITQNQRALQEISRPKTSTVTSTMPVTLEYSTMEALATLDSQTLRRAAQLMTTNILGQYISLIAKTTVELMLFQNKTKKSCQVGHLMLIK